MKEEAPLKRFRAGKAYSLCDWPPNGIPRSQTRTQSLRDSSTSPVSTTCQTCILTGDLILDASIVSSWHSFHSLEEFIQETLRSAGQLLSTIRSARARFVVSLIQVHQHG
jgi:hypothetical protein